jgi:hypothetical protein
MATVRALRIPSPVDEHRIAIPCRCSNTGRHIHGRREIAKDEMHDFLAATNEWRILKARRKPIIRWKSSQMLEFPPRVVISAWKMPVEENYR